MLLYLESWHAAPLHCFSDFLRQTSQLSEIQISMSSNSHTAEDTKACHLQKLQLQKCKEKDVGVPDTLIDLCDVQSKTAVMSA